MSDRLDVIVVDDDANVCKVISEIVNKFYTWGEVFSFTEVDVAIASCMRRDVGVAIFIIDVFLGGKTGFSFLDIIEEKFPTAHEDSIIITGNASEDVVNMCVASDVTHLLEKPIRSYALQLSVRSIVSKYLKFSKRILQDPVFAAIVEKVDHPEAANIQ